MACINIKAGWCGVISSWIHEEKTSLKLAYLANQGAVVLLNWYHIGQWDSLQFEIEFGDTKIWKYIRHELKIETGKHDLCFIYTPSMKFRE